MTLKLFPSLNIKISGPIKMCHEVVSEIFVKAPVKGPYGGRPIPCLAARMLYEGVRREWLSVDLGPGKTPRVSMGPGVQDGEEGYSIRKEIVDRE